MKQTCPCIFLCLLVATKFGATAHAQTTAFNDPQPQQYNLTARASEIDSRVQAHPEIDFLIESKDGKPADVEHASVDTRVAPKGQLVIWLMGHNQPLFDRLNSYGLHAIQVHYANKWFSKYYYNVE